MSLCCKLLALVFALAFIYGAEAQNRQSENHRIKGDSLAVGARYSNSESFRLFSIVGGTPASQTLGSSNFSLRSGSLTVVSVSDQDNDGVLNGEDNCSSEFNPSQQNSDDDPLGDACDPDDDNDDVVDAEDNCQFEVNPDQTDTDDDDFGDLCDTDDDGDGLLDDEDNCPLIANIDQADSNGNGIGDACEVDDLCIPVTAQNNATVLVCL